MSPTWSGSGPADTPLYVWMYEVSCVRNVCNISIFALDSVPTWDRDKTLCSESECDVRIKGTFRNWQSVRPSIKSKHSNQRKLLQHRLWAQTDHTDPISHGRKYIKYIIAYFSDKYKHSEPAIRNNNWPTQPRQINYVKLISRKTIVKTGHVNHKSSFFLVINLLHLNILWYYRNWQSWRRITTRYLG